MLRFAHAVGGDRFITVRWAAAVPPVFAGTVQVPRQSASHPAGLFGIRQQESCWGDCRGRSGPPRFHPMLAVVVKVDMHLSSVGIAEFINLEIHNQQGLQASVEEDKIDPEPIVVDANSPLTAHECKVISSCRRAHELLQINALLT